jgi:hypothetical protein
VWGKGFNSIYPPISGSRSAGCGGDDLASGVARVDSEIAAHYGGVVEMCISCHNHFRQRAAR